MALYANGYRLGNGPFKRGLGALTTIYNGAGSVFNARLPTSAMRSSYGLFGAYASYPVGNLHPECWMLPQKGGAMSMRPLGNGGLAANLIPSQPMAIDLTGSGDLTAIGALAVAMAVALTGEGTLTATINGYMNMTCDLNGDGSLTADMEGIAALAIDMLGQGDLAATIAAFGNMEIDIVVTGTGLTTGNIGAAIWSYLIGGTEAQSLLQTAGSGGVDYDTLWASMPAALKESLAAYVLAAATAAPIAANFKEVNDTAVGGTGTLGDEWGPV